MQPDFNKVLLDQISDAIIVKTPEGRVIYWSQGAEDVFGYTSDEAVGRLVGELIIPSGVSSAIRDISERKQVEQALRDQAQIMNLVNDSIFMCDLEGRITYWNQGAQRIYGWTKEEVLGQVAHDLLKTKSSQSLDEIRAQFLAAEDWEGELMHTRRDGTCLTVVSRWTLQKDATNRPVAFLEMNYDITDRKRIEQALQDKNIELRNAAESKNRFLANMSHELRTPLNGIIGFAEFLADGKPGHLNPKQKEYLDDILNSGRHLLQLINDILDLAKVEANKMDLYPEIFSLARVIEGVCAVAKPIAQKKSIEIAIEVANELGEVVLDQQRFKQILYNLVSNAVKFTDEGGRVDVFASFLEPRRYHPSEPLPTSCQESVPRYGSRNLTII